MYDTRIEQTIVWAQQLPLLLLAHPRAQQVWLLMQDAWRTKSLKDKFTLWFKPTGYRPADVTEKYPVHKIEDVYNFEKYHPASSVALNVWSWIQLILILLFISYLFGNIAAINKLNNAYIYIYGGFIFLSVYAFTELMDRNRYAIFWEGIKNLFGILIIYRLGDWFGISTYASWINYVLVVYFILSTVITGWFVLQHKKEDEQLTLAL